MNRVFHKLRVRNASFPRSSLVEMQLYVAIANIAVVALHSGRRHRKAQELARFVVDIKCDHFSDARESSCRDVMSPLRMLRRDAHLHS